VKAPVLLLLIASCGAVPVAAPLLAQEQVSAGAAPVFAAQKGREQCRGVEGYAATPGIARTFLWRPEWLAAEKARVAADPTYAKSLRDAAEAALKRGRYSVTDKSKTPPSGDKHDYYSIGPYWWPTPGKPKGEPYTRRDGVTNPESRGPEFDKDRMSKFTSDVTKLALAWHHVGDKRYAEHAAMLLRAWFLSPETRMNPNLNHGQAVPGVNNGRGEGIIELAGMAELVDAVGLIENAGVMTETELAGLETWYRDFVRWMATSQNGREERAKTNNHGMHYDYLITHMALFAGLEPVAKQMVGAFPAKRIAVQMAADGGLPDELERTRSLHYSFFALNGAAKLATVGECVGLDLWAAQTADGRGLAKGFAFLEPYAELKKWPHKEIAVGDADKERALRQNAAEQLTLMAWGTGNIGYQDSADQYLNGAVFDGDYWLSPLVRKTDREVAK
jgi:hypothetical protein